MIMRRGTSALAILLLTFVSCRPGPDVSSDSSQGHAVEATSSSGVELILVPSGTFTMGSAAGRADESPPHEVIISGFGIDKYEVTQDQYRALEIPDPSQFKDPRRPVEQVRWSDAALFCNERSRNEGLEPCYDELTFNCNFVATGYRLPTEAEWEYAARAGSDRERGFSGTNLGNYACYSGNSRKKTATVGRHKPNAWGLHDMLGNVQEWCHDVYDPGHYAKSEKQNPRGPEAGKKRVMRGGAWNSRADACRVAVRVAEIPGITDACFARNTFGFRCVRRLTAEERKLVEPAGGER